MTSGAELTAFIAELEAKGYAAVSSSGSPPPPWWDTAFAVRHVKTAARSFKDIAAIKKNLNERMREVAYDIPVIQAEFRRLLDRMKRRPYLDPIREKHAKRLREMSPWNLQKSSRNFFKDSLVRDLRDPKVILAAVLDPKGPGIVSLPNLDASTRFRMHETIGEKEGVCSFSTGTNRVLHLVSDAWWAKIMPLPSDLVVLEILPKIKRQIKDAAFSVRAAKERAYYARRYDRYDRYRDYSSGGDEDEDEYYDERDYYDDDDDDYYE